MSTLENRRHPMPPDVAQALAERGLTDEYEARPAYQRRNYIGWIERSKHDSARERRFRLMLDELEAGNAFMGMQYRTRMSQSIPAGE